MSKIGKMPIKITSATVEVNGNVVSVNGPKAKFIHELPVEITAKVEDNNVFLSIEKISRVNKMNWGMHRALLANKVKGAEVGFEQKMRIVGLGYKALLSGKKVVFSLGYSHKIDYELPEGVELTTDKPGQLLTFKSHDKELLGAVCAKVRGFRPPEPYKGTGIMKDGEQIIRKAGKAKSA
jgi:large subunit ribosomal protein L6